MKKIVKIKINSDVSNVRHLKEQEHIIVMIVIYVYMV